MMKRILAVAMVVSLSAWAQAAKPAEAKPAETKAAEKAEKKAVEKAEKKDAGAAAAAAPMTPPKPSAETMKLGKLFGSKKSMSGKTAAGAMGPGSPEMAVKSTADCRAIAEKFFYACDIDETMGTGKQANTWKSHFVTGWDVNAAAYKAVMVNNMGMMMPMDGVMTDTTYQVTSTQEQMMMGEKMKVRLTWDWSDPKEAKFTNEHQVAGGAWQVFETETSKGGVK